MPVELAPLRLSEAEAFWAGKVPMAADEFKAVGARARERAFAVSGINRMDLAARVHEALARALRDGTTVETFKRDVLPAFEEEGGISPARLETIFRTNVQSAYLAGRYAQMIGSRHMPYWRYSAVDDARTRPAHRALDGIVRHRDDVFWDYFYPPNGFNCRCSVFPAAKPDKVETGIPDLIEPVDPITGLPLPPVRPWPDRGFDGNVGKDWLSGLSPTEVRDGEFSPAAWWPPLCPQGRGQYADDQCWEPLADIDPRHILRFTPKDILHKGQTQVAYIQAFLAEFGLDFGQSGLVTLPGVNFPLVVSDRLFLDKRDGTWKVTKGGREQFMLLLARTIQNPFEIWQGSERRRDGRIVPVLNLIRLFTDGERKVGGFGVFKLYGRKWSGATVFPPNPENEAAMLRYLEAQRRELIGRGGVRLYREP